MASNIRASAKVRLLGDPDYPDQQAKQTNKQTNKITEMTC